jgi:hypothetical protein
MAVIGSAYADGYSQRYTCGFGIDCAVGGVVGRHRFLEAIEEQHLPPQLVPQERASLRAYKGCKTLGSILRAQSQS